MNKDGLLNIINYRVETGYSCLKEAESHPENGFLSTAIT
jgi:hypothetical protein